MAFDEARQQMVLFGSNAGFGISEKPVTWLFDGYDWLARTPAVQPRLRNNYAMAYDAVRQQIVLFGGVVTRVGSVNETWLWNGTNWMLATPAHSPGVRSYSSMAFDAARQQVILFGGVLADSIVVSPKRYNDTWAWDGNDWTQLFPSNSPPVTTDFGDVMASDTSKEVLLLSSSPDPAVAKTWRWNGMDWTAAPSEMVPLDRSMRGGLAYDTANQVYVFFGNNANTWLWDGTNWAQRILTSGPSGRFGFSMAYDPIRRKVVLNSGLTGYYPAHSETWLWDGNNWSLLSGTVQWFDLRAYPDGVGNFTRISVPTNLTVEFINNVANTPVTWLASGNVVIEGTLNLSGITTNLPATYGIEASGGPGGFAGGLGGLDFSQTGSYSGTPGHGPGGGAPGVSAGQASQPAKGPATYGNIYLQPLLGGSGGGGDAFGGRDRNGGGGGGAILISSSGSITVNGSITAQGGLQEGVTQSGSGGEIRLQAETITGIGVLNADYDGRIRLESYYEAFHGPASPVPITSIPVPTRIFKPSTNSLVVLSVAGQDVPLPPSGNRVNPDVTFNETGAISIRVRGTGLEDNTPISLRLTASELLITATTNLSNGEATFSNLNVPKGPGIIEVSAVFPLLPE